MPESIDSLCSLGRLLIIQIITPASMLGGHYLVWVRCVVQYPSPKDNQSYGAEISIKISAIDGI